MRLAVISFTGRGGQLNRFLCEKLNIHGHRTDGFEKRAGKAEAPLQPVEGSLREWTGRAFSEYDGMIFVGACGIAVRSIAPFVKDKFQDPAVVVIDEGAKFCISLLSGHVGCANELCSLVAGLAGAVPVISTATDVNGCFAVDVFARKNGLEILSRCLAKELSAAVLEGKQIPFFSTQPVEGELPKELILCETEEELRKHPGLKLAVSERRISVNSGGQEDILYLIPRTVTAGMGCRRGTEEAVLLRKLKNAFSDAGIFLQALEQVTTIELKQDEKGLHDLAEGLGVPFVWYTREQLLALPGEFSGSAFVKETVGIDCVCERAALKGSLERAEKGEADAREEGRLILNKQAGDGVTVAAAVRKTKLYFNRKENER